MTALMVFLFCRTYYEEYAFLLDEDLTSVLAMLLVGLCACCEQWLCYEDTLHHAFRNLASER